MKVMGTFGGHGMGGGDTHAYYSHDFPLEPNFVNSGALEGLGRCTDDIPLLKFQS